MPNRRGVALIVVLLMVSIITALTIQLNRDTRSEVTGAANLSDGIRLRYIAQSGFAVGEALLLADRTPFDALTEQWANTEMLSLISEGFFDNGSFKLAIQDEEGKIAINKLVTGSVYNEPVRRFPPQTAYRSLLPPGPAQGRRARRCHKGLDRRR